MAEPLVAASPKPGLVTGPPPAEAGYAGGTAVVGQGRDARRPGVAAFLQRSELRLVFGRHRNQALLVVVALFPLIIGIGLRLTQQPNADRRAPAWAFITQLAGNGVFLSFIALTLLLILVMPLAVAVVAGGLDGTREAGYGTLRSLLAIPAQAGSACSP